MAAMKNNWETTQGETGEARQKKQRGTRSAFTAQPRNRRSIREATEIRGDTMSTGPRYFYRPMLDVYVDCLLVMWMHEIFGSEALACGVARIS